MDKLSRRSFISVSVGGLSALSGERTASAAPALQCNAVGLPHSLTVDCSVTQNLKLFLQNQEKLGLVGLVTMKPVLGRFAYATMFLFPWLKPGASGWVPQAFIQGAFMASAMKPAGINLDEQFCVYVLKAPLDSFIGFTVDKPMPSALVRRKWPWHANVDQIGGPSVSVGWGSGNLNQRWFAGSRFIRDGDDCNGKYWRALIVDGLRRASHSVC